MIASPGLPSFLVQCLAALKRQASSFRPPSSRNSSLGWLFSPTPAALGFAIRTTAAALLALVIAMWLELDDPQWAPMTVWIVAQGSRGESMSKSRWRLVGTVLGVLSAITLVAAFPQQPLLFLACLSLWLGLCCTLATLVHNFRSYALVLAGYTCVIISMDSLNEPENVFLIAMSRASYILLGIICEAIMGSLFAHNLATTARRTIRNKLGTALGSVTKAVAGILEGQEHAISRSRALFTPLLSINDQIEFSEVEMGPHGHEGDHARAALSAVSTLLSRGLGMAVRLKSLTNEQDAFQETSKKAQHLFESASDRLETDEDVETLIEDLRLLRAECRQYIVDALTKELELDLPSQDPQIVALLDQRILHNALDDLIAELEGALREFISSHKTQPGDHFHFRLQSHRDWREAFYNGIRASVALFTASLIWLVTAWPAGLGFITFVGVVCGLFGTRENPVLATTNFFKGSLWAAGVSGILVFVFMPTPADWEMLVAILAVPMFIGGLAARNTSTALQSAAYTLLLPNLTHPSNHIRWDEVSWWNSTLATVLAFGMAVMMFRLILPFDSASERWRMRRTMVQDMRTIAISEPIPKPHDWTTRNIDRFARVIRHAGPTPSPTIEGYLQGTLATMTIGLNVIRLRNISARNQIPESAQKAIQPLLMRLSRTPGHYVHAARSARNATALLRQIEAREANLSTRVELTRAIACLIVISHELNANTVFLDSTRPFKVTAG